MKINKENKEVKVEPKKESTLTDAAKMEVQCHLLIKDKDTNEVIVNRRG